MDDYCEQYKEDHRGYACILVLDGRLVFDQEAKRDCAFDISLECYVEDFLERQ